MAGGGSAGMDLTGQLKTLTKIGVVGDLSDGQLLQRYLSASDGAFAALVQRHGPMVFCVCRQVLGDRHDAQDAFQATFLILARKARSVRKADSLSSWLHGVALRCALRAKAQDSRRKVYEREGATLKAAEAEHGVESWEELHEEVARLPQRFREPVVLCYLEGLSTEAAAVRLGCPKGTVLSRLSRARDQLRDRLVRRGFAPAQAMAWVTLQAPTSIPDRLVATATTVATSAAGTVPKPVLILSLGVLHAMTLAKLKTAAIAVGLTSLVLGIAGVRVYAFQTHDDTPAQPAPAAIANPQPQPTPATAPPTRSQRVYDSLVKDKAPDEFVSTVPPFSSSEIAAELALARRKAAYTQKLVDKKVVSQQEVDLLDLEVQRIEGRIAGRIEQLDEEHELLMIRLEAKQAELDGAKAEAEVTAADVAMNERLNSRIKGSVNPEEVKKAEALARRKDANVTLQNAEVRETEARIRQVERRLKSLVPLLKDAKPLPGTPK